MERLTSIPRRAQDYYNSLSTTSRYALWAYAALQVSVIGWMVYVGPAAMFEM